jgi:SRSO17 transposase
VRGNHSIEVHQGWRTEENNEQGKDLLGLDQHQVRTWTAWHHMVTVCMFAHAFLAVQHAGLKTTTGTVTTTHEQPTSPGNDHHRHPRQDPTG